MSDMGELPTTVIGLVGFLCVGFAGSLIAIIRYFLAAQKRQTELYMTYIETKNGHLEKAKADFGLMLKEQGERHDRMLNEYANRLEVALASKN